MSERYLNEQQARALALLWGGRYSRELAEDRVRSLNDMPLSKHLKYAPFTKEELGFPDVIYSADIVYSIINERFIEGTISMADTIEEASQIENEREILYYSPILGYCYVSEQC